MKIITTPLIIAFNKNNTLQGPINLLPSSLPLAMIYKKKVLIDFQETG